MVLHGDRDGDSDSGSCGDGDGNGDTARPVPTARSSGECREPELRPRESWRYPVARVPLGEVRLYPIGVRARSDEP